MVEPHHRTLSVKRQCEPFGISRSSHYYRQPNGGEEADIKDVFRQAFLPGKIVWKYPSGGG